MADKPSSLVLPPGPYDRIAADVLQGARAEAVVIVVFGGRAGTSGSIAATSGDRFVQLRALVEAVLNPATPATPE